MSEERIDELEKELAEAKKERDSAIAELAQFHEAMEREKKPDWEKWLKDLADRLEAAGCKSTVPLGPSDVETAARQLRYMANSFTLKANFVPSNLRIKELEAACAAKDKALEFISQRVSHAWASGKVGVDVGDILSSCAKGRSAAWGEGWKSPEDAGLLDQRIKELEEALSRATLAIASQVKMEGENAKLEAEAGAMRELLSVVDKRFESQSPMTRPPLAAEIDWLLRSTTAGQSILDELERLRKTVHWLQGRLPQGAWSMPAEVSQTLAECASQQKGEPRGFTHAPPIEEWQKPAKPDEWH